MTPGTPQSAPSLQAWRRFFTKAVLKGYDINDFSFLQEPSTFTFQGDQSSRSDIARFLSEYRGMDFGVIVDDGSHAASHQEISLAALFPYLSPGGMYIVEDLGWQPFPEVPTTRDVLSRFSTSGTFDFPYVTGTEAQYLESAVEKVEIYKPNDSECAVISKKRDA
jgi:hypothetical protein